MAEPVKKVPLTQTHTAQSVLDSIVNAPDKDAQEFALSLRKRMIAELMGFHETRGLTDAEKEELRKLKSLKRKRE